MLHLALITPCPIIGHPWDEPVSVLLTLILHINTNGVTSQSPLLPAKETQLPQRFPIKERLHSLNHLCGCMLHSFKWFTVLKRTFPIHAFSWQRTAALPGRLILMCWLHGVGKWHPAGNLHSLWPVFTVFTLPTVTLQKCKPCGNVAQHYCSLSEV